MSGKENLISAEKGSVMVEFALISTVLMMLLVGIIQCGLLFNTQLNLENAAREGARFAALPDNANDDAATEAFIETVARVPLGAGDISISPSVRLPGDAITVTIQYDYRLLVTLGVFPETIQLNASAVMMQ
jgi:Flp pilus assembly protein TadG